MLIHILSDRETKILENQLSNPQHCYIETRPGHYLVHTKSPKDKECPIPDEWVGQPIRFSKSSAENIVKKIPGAKIIRLKCC